MTFTLPGGSLRARVQIRQRYAGDGKHARQRLTGRVISGSGRYRHAHGTISGGGTDLEAAPGNVTQSDLRYTLTLQLG